MDGSSKNKKNILIVDDTEANIDILVDTLGDDYEVSVAMDGSSALEDVHSNPPDLILLDIMMPGIDGYQVCQILKADKTTKDIPIIFITALSEVEDETKGLKLGAVDYVTKPISPPILKARVDIHLELKQAREELEKQNHILQENINLREEIDRISRHDLKTPLNSIISIPRIILQDRNRLEPDHIKLLEIIEKSGHAMLSMINLSLDLYKIEQKTYKLQPVTLDILTIIKKIIFDLRSLADAKQIYFNLKINGEHVSDNDLFGVSGEELLCYSMFANIIKNAVEASPDNEVVTINLSSSNHNQNNLFENNTKSKLPVKSGGEVCISIHNKGVVPASIRENFFDKYSTSGKKGGTGLGTYSAKLMAQTLGGDISMSTNETYGTTITVKLKESQIDDSLLSGSLIPLINIPSKFLSENRKSGEQKSDEQKSDEQKSDEQLPSLRILVVDDDDFNSFIIEKYLHCNDIAVELAQNGQVALNKFIESRYDMVLMDMEMPVMDGMEAASLMRKWENEQREIQTVDNNHPNINNKSVIVALSGHDDFNTCQTCLDIGFDDYLSKPVSNRQLYETILKHFSNQTVQESSVQESFKDRALMRSSVNSSNNENIALDDGDIITGSYSVDIDADLEDLIPSFLVDKKDEIESISKLISIVKSQSICANNNGDNINLSLDTYYLQIMRLGHRLKGGFNMYGFKRHGAISYAIEESAKQKDFVSIIKHIELLKALLKEMQIRYVSI